jgi:hypothetical protein
MRIVSINNVIAAAAGIVRKEDMRVMCEGEETRRIRRLKLKLKRKRRKAA